MPTINDVMLSQIEKLAREMMADITSTVPAEPQDESLTIEELQEAVDKLKPLDTVRHVYVHCSSIHLKDQIIQALCPCKRHMLILMHADSWQEIKQEGLRFSGVSFEPIVGHLFSLPVTEVGNTFLGKWMDMRLTEECFL